MKKIFKITILLMILIIFSITNITYAFSFDIWGDAKDFIDTGESHTGATQVGQEALSGIINLFGGTLKSEFNYVIDFLWGLGLLVIFISTVVLGIKYMFVLPEEKSRIKQATTPYIVGVVIIFGALSIWKFVIYLLEAGL